LFNALPLTGSMRGLKRTLRMRRWFPVLALMVVLGAGGSWWLGSSRTQLPEGLERHAGTLAGPPAESGDHQAAVPVPAPASALSDGQGGTDRAPGPPPASSIWREPLTGMEFVWVTGGCFWMGGATAETRWDKDEIPRHKVCLDGFWLGRFEVTRGQFRIFLDRGGYVTDAEREGYAWAYAGKWEQKPGFSWRHPGFAQDENHPVVNVSWHDAKAMAAWLEAESRRPVALPTEAQWEYACRAGTEGVRFWGDPPDSACAFANVADRTAAREFPAWIVHSCADGAVFTAAVGSYTANPWGFHDMLGNVWEWCEDVYQADAYAHHALNNPLMVKGGRERVVRGGSWYSRPESVRCADRDRLREPSRRSHDQGFRLAIER